MNQFRRAAWLLILASFWQTVPSFAQTGAQQEDARASKQLAAELFEIDVATALVGRTNAWPASDPKLSLEDWRTSLANAPAISVAEWFQRQPGVSLRVARSNTLAPILKDHEGWMRATVLGLQHSGLKVDMNSAVELQVVVRLGGGEVKTRRDGQVIKTFNAYSLRFDCSLVVPSRIRRGVHVFHSELALATMTFLQSKGEVPTAKELSDLMQFGIRATVKKAMGDTDKPAPKSTWTEWSRTNQGAQAAFAASFKKSRADLGPGLEFAGGFSDVSGSYVSAAPVFGMGEIAREGGLEGYWRRRLPANGIPCEVWPAPKLDHTWIVVPGPEGEMLSAASRLTVHDRDALVPLGEGYLRMQGFSHVDDSLTTVALAGKFDNTLMEQLGEQFKRIRNIARSKNGRPAHIQHAQAPAIKRSLVKRKRIDVPDWAIDQLANRIAFEIESNTGISESARRSWMTSEAGQPVFDLAQFGEAVHGGRISRKVQEACRVSIQRIELGDPLGLYAFDNVFSTRTEGDSIVLADDYLKRFEKTRPQGKGALNAERVQSGSQAARRLIRLYAHDEAAAEKAIRPYRDVLNTHEVLTCTYYDESDPLKKSPRGYWFWHKEAPPNWKQILDAAPKNCGLHRIGPPVSLAPDYMREAKQLLQAYRKQTGH